MFFPIPIFFLLLVHICENLTGERNYVLFTSEKTLIFCLLFPRRPAPIETALDWYINIQSSLMSLPANPNTGTSQAHLATGNQLPQIGNDKLVQPRETGNVVPQRVRPDAAETKPKPFAHFVAGGYVLEFSLANG